MKFKVLILEELTEDDLTNLYTLNYKYDIMRSSKPKRFDSEDAFRKKQIKTNELGRAYLDPLENDIIDELLLVFNSWLESHAITEPKKWAAARVKFLEGFEPVEILESITSEYINYSVYNKKNFDELSLSELYNEQLGDVSGSELNTFINEHLKNDEINRIRNDIEHYKGQDVDYSEDIKQLEEDLEHIENNEFDDIYVDVHTILYAQDMGYDVFEEMYEHLVFPLWFEHWGPRGIEDTRNRIERVANQLTHARGLKFTEKNIREKNIIINSALGAVHQTGGMMDYIESENPEITNELLSRLSDMDVEHLNKELEKDGYI